MGYRLFTRWFLPLPKGPSTLAITVFWYDQNNLFCFVSKAHINMAYGFYYFYPKNNNW